MLFLSCTLAAWGRFAPAFLWPFWAWLLILLPVVSGCASEPQPLATIDNPLRETITSIAYSADGKWLAAGFQHRLPRGAARTAYIKVWYARSNAERTTLAIDQSVNAVAFSPDGKWFAVGCGNYIPSDMGEVPRKRGEVRIYNCNDFKEHTTMKVKGEVIALGFSPDSARLAGSHNIGTESGPSVVQIWDVPSFDVRFSVQSLSFLVWGLAFSADSKTIAVGDRGETSTQGIIRFFDSSEGVEKPFLANEGGAPTGLYFVPNSKLLLATGPGHRFWDLSTRKEIRVPGVSGFFRSNMAGTAVSPDGKLVALKWAEGNPRSDKLLLFDLQANKVRAEWKLARPHVNEIAFSADGKRIAIAGDPITIWAVP